MSESNTGGGPLAGIRVVELAGIGPAPHAGFRASDAETGLVTFIQRFGSALNLNSTSIFSRSTACTPSTASARVSIAHRRPRARNSSASSTR